MKEKHLNIYWEEKEKDALSLALFLLAELIEANEVGSSEASHKNDKERRTGA